MRLSCISAYSSWVTRQSGIAPCPKCEMPSTEQMPFPTRPGLHGIVRSLLAAGANPDADGEGMPTAMVCLATPRSPKDATPKATRSSLQSFSPHHPCACRAGAAHCQAVAAGEGHLSVVKELLHARADPNRPLRALLCGGVA